jgi:hypothetical protein
MLRRSPHATRALCLPAFVLVLSLSAACASPPNREIADAQQALNDARDAGAEQYSPESYKAAADAYRLANEAVMTGDYRLALNRALESREHAQTATRTAADGRARARDEAQQILADVTTQAMAVTAQFEAAEKARTMSRAALRDVREALTSINDDVQKAGAAIDAENYVEAQEVLTGVKMRIEFVNGQFEAARKTQRTRRRTS